MAKRDADRLLSTFTGPDGDKRVLIVQRPDNTYSYRYQCSDNEMPGDWDRQGPVAASTTPSTLLDRKRSIGCRGWHTGARIRPRFWR